jgi:hypothetical protein
MFVNFLSDSDQFSPLGTISLQREPDGNYTGRFALAENQLTLIKQQFVDAAAANRLYRYRTITVGSAHNAVTIASWNKPVGVILVSRSRVANVFQ